MAKKMVKNQTKKELFLGILMLIMFCACDGDQDICDCKYTSKINYKCKHDIDGLEVRINDNKTDLKVQKCNGNYQIRFTKKHEGIGIKDYGQLYLYDGKPSFVQLFTPFLNLGEDKLPDSILVSIEIETNKLFLGPLKR